MKPNPQLRRRGSGRRLSFRAPTASVSWVRRLSPPGGGPLPSVHGGCWLFRGWDIAEACVLERMPSADFKKIRWPKRRAPASNERQTWPSGQPLRQPELSNGPFASMQTFLLKNSGSRLIVTSNVGTGCSYLDPACKFFRTILI